MVFAIPSAAPGRGTVSCLRFLERFVSVSAARGQKLRQTGGFLPLIIAQLSPASSQPGIIIIAHNNYQDNGAHHIHHPPYTTLGIYNLHYSPVP